MDIEVPGLGTVSIKGNTPTPEEDAAIQAAWKQKNGPSPARDVAAQIGSAIGADRASAGDVMRWGATRAEKALTNTASTARTGADLQSTAISTFMRFFGGSQEDAAKAIKVVGPMNFLLNVGKYIPTGEQMRQGIDQLTGFKEQDAPKSWGVPGQMLDAGTEALLAAPAGPGGVVRNLVPSAISGAASEGAGHIPGVQGTWMEGPAKFIAGLLGGVSGAGAQNMATSSLKGASNFAFSDLRGAKEQAARILGRQLGRDNMTWDELVKLQQEALPGTPIGALAGENVRNTMRAAYSLPGEARSTIGQGAGQFFEGAPDRVEPVIGRVSTQAPTDVRAPQLRQQGQSAAQPLYQASGANDPQAILATRPGAPVPTPSAMLGPDGQPLMTTRPGAPVTTVTTTNPVLTSPGLKQFLANNDDVQAAIKQAKRLAEFKNMPDTSMPVLDKVYKNLGGKLGVAIRAGDGTVAHELSGLQQQLLAHIEAENPTYAKALAAYSAPHALADAAESGFKLAGANMSPEAFAAAYNALPPAAQKEFLGGVATFMRGRVDATARTTPAERFWPSPQFQKKMAAILPTVSDAGPSDVLNTLQKLTGEVKAAKNIRTVTGGSPTLDKAAAASDLAAGPDHSGAMMKVLTGDLPGAALAGLSKYAGVFGARVGEGRTAAVNKALADLTMQTNPVEAVKTKGLIEAARLAAEKTARNRQRAFITAPLAGLLSQ